MKRGHIFLLAAFVLGIAFALVIRPLEAKAAAVSWDRFQVGAVRPINLMDTVWGNIFNGTSTTAASNFPYASTTAISVSGLTSGRCVQTGTGGLLTITASACGAGSITSVTATYPVVSSGGATPNISLAFGTTTANTWGLTQTFTLSPVFSTLGAGTVNSTAGGTIYNTATSTPTVTSPITYSGTLGQFIGGVSGAFGCATCAISGGNALSTTSPWTGSGVAYRVSESAVSTAATTSLAVSSPLTVTGTLGALIGGTNNTINCQAASGSQAGCLSSTDWNTFNNKVSSTSLSATVPITYSSATGIIACNVASGSQPGCLSSIDWSTFNNKQVGGFQISTTSPISQGNLAYFTGVTPTSIGGVATGTITGSTGLSVTAGQSVIGSGLTITNTGVTSIAGTTNQVTLSASTGAVTVSLAGPHNFTTLTGLALGSGTSALSAYTGTSCTNQFVRSLNASGVATCASLSATDFGNVSANTVFGNPTGASAQPTFFATSSLFTGTIGQTAYFAGTGALVGTSSLVVDTTSNVGIGTTTPFGNLSVARTSTAAVVIADAFNTIRALFNTASTTGSIFTVMATTTTNTQLLAGTGLKLFDVDQYGHLTASSTRASPTVACSPSGGTLGVNANDVTGEFTSGTLSTSCTLTFASSYGVTPQVLITPNSTVQMVAVTAKSTTAFTVSFAAAITTDTVSYFVIQP